MGLCPRLRLLTSFLKVSIITIIPLVMQNVKSIAENGQNAVNFRLQKCINVTIMYKMTEILAFFCALCYNTVVMHYMKEIPKNIVFRG